MPGKRSQNPKKRKSQKKDKKPVLSSRELFDAAQEALAFDEFEQAHTLFRQCLKQAPDNVEYLDAFGAFLAEIGHVEEAAIVLKRSMQLSPDAGYEKYMYLGQLVEGEEGLELARSGISLLEKAIHDAEASQSKSEVNQEAADGMQVAEGAQQAGESMEEDRAGGEASTSGRADIEELKSQLGGALCSLAEMVMVNASEDLESVVADVEGLLQRARAADPKSPEPLQTLASLRYETGRPEEALASLKQSLQLWFKPHKEDDSDAEDEDEELGLDDELDPEPGSSSMDNGHDASKAESAKKPTDEEDDFVPSYEFRIEAAKLLVELDDSTETAIEVLEDLLAENDVVPEVWHLLGYAYYGGLMLEEAEEVASHGAALAQKQGADEDLIALFDDLKSAIADAKEKQACPEDTAAAEPEKA